MTKETKDQFDYIRDTFAGADGGIRFVKLKVLIEEMDRQHQAGGQQGHTAGLVLDKTIGAFKRFIELAQGEEWND